MNEGTRKRGRDARRAKEIEGEIDQLAAELWGLTPQELADIKRSLEELL